MNLFVGTETQFGKGTGGICIDVRLAAGAVPASTRVQE